MWNVNRRLKILERTFFVQDLALNDDLTLDDESLADATRCLSDEDLNALIAANEAEEEGIPLTLRQIGARRTWNRVIACRTRSDHGADACSCEGIALN
jgi:hypothetical protein